METFAVPHTLENGEIGHLAITNDISERVNREKELYKKNLELEEAKRLSVVGEFTAGIAHEINNPLAVISAKAQLLELELNKVEIPDSSINERIRNSIDIINETVEHASDLIKNLKTFSGKVDLENMDLVALSKPLDMVFKIINKRCVNEGISLNMQADSKLKVYCNSAGLAQALLNLIINSIDAIENKKNKWIKIATEASQGTIKILITDSGSGIPPEIAHNMTQPFFSTKPLGKGTGLGLGISLKLIQKMNGNLYYNPKAVHTQFVIELSNTLPN
jgi:C4-dicarboxylate-specific signal transduction histidine kinase